jgi:hypothetical protein
LPVNAALSHPSLSPPLWWMTCVLLTEEVIHGFLASAAPYTSAATTALEGALGFHEKYGGD